MLFAPLRARFTRTAKVPSGRLRFTWATKARVLTLITLIGVLISILGTSTILHTVQSISNSIHKLGVKPIIVAIVILLFALTLWEAFSGQFPIRQMQPYEKRLLWKRFVWGFAAALWSAAVVLFLKIYSPDIGPFWEVSMPVSTFLYVFVTTEPLARMCLFGISKNRDKYISQLWYEFVNRYPAADDLTRAKLLLFLSEQDPTLKVEIQGSFTQYLMILCAATHFAQREWFAIYKLSVHAWTDINGKARKYFQALAATQLTRNRFVIGPREELETIGSGVPLLIDTRASGAILTCVERDSIDPSVEVSDCAIFDDNLAVVAEDLPTSHHFNPDLYQLPIKILRGAHADEYLQMKTYLEHTPAFKRFDLEDKPTAPPNAKNRTVGKNKLRVRILNFGE